MCCVVDIEILIGCLLQFVVFLGLCCPCTAFQDVSECDKLYCGLRHIFSCICGMYL
jgi:hypothetical protein